MTGQRTPAGYTLLWRRPQRDNVEIVDILITGPRRLLAPRADAIVGAAPR